VQRTEVALQNRRARRTAAGGMSDGDKVKLQLYLDFQEFARTVEDVGVELSSIAGIAQLKSLTVEAEQLLQQNENGK
jgi:conserved oligomeric Golgi complex subunit 2